VHPEGEPQPEDDGEEIAASQATTTPVEWKRSWRLVKDE
jgi:hypothetical protein